MSDMSQKFETLEHRHIAFNAQRTLRSAKSSQFEIDNFNGLQLLKDSNIAFANQIWGVNEQTIMHLTDAMSVYDEMSMSPEVDIIDVNLTPSVKDQLIDSGFELVETLNFLTINLNQVEITSSDIVVERQNNDDADKFLDLLKTSGLQTTAEIWQLKKQLYCTDTFRCYMAKIDGKACAMATTFIDGQYGLMANAYTHQDYQKQGCQTALLQARINDAKQIGLTDLIVDVVPNTSSERNCLKVGFKPLNTRYIWQRKTQKSPT